MTSGIFRCADRTRYNKLILYDVFFSSRTVPHSDSDLQEYNLCYVGKCNYEPKSLQSMSCFHLQINVPGIPNHSLQQAFDAGNVIRSHGTVSIFNDYVCIDFLWKKMYIGPVNNDGFTHSLSLLFI
jgi:hypothetical protein